MLLKKLLQSLVNQERQSTYSFSVVVIDNDSEMSAANIVAQFAGSDNPQITYLVEPNRNIAAARNASVRSASGNYIAFIDDDEVPASNWLVTMYTALKRFKADGILAPVLPAFDEPPPNWIRKGRFFDRPRHNTGYLVGLADARTGNVLMKRGALQDLEGPFDVEFATGGEDVDLFQRLFQKGKRFVWCDEAAVLESVPQARCSRIYLLRRAILRGSNSTKNPRRRTRLVLKSAFALPVYIFALPGLALVGHHLFMKYLIKTCDHLGRLLSFIGIKPIKDRAP